MYNVCALVGAVFLGAACSSSARAAPQQPPPAEPAPRTEEQARFVIKSSEHPSPGTPETIDEGKFAVYVGDRLVGDEHLEIVATEDGGLVVHSELELTVEGDTLSSSSELTLDPSWRPLTARSHLTTSDGDEVFVELSEVDGVLEEKTTVGGEPATKVAATNDVDLYLGEASVSFAAPLCRPMAEDVKRLLVFPDLALPVERAVWVVLPPRSEEKPPSVLTLVILDPESRDPMIALCQKRKLVLVWLPAIRLAAGRRGYEPIARELAAEERTLEE